MGLTQSIDNAVSPFPNQELVTAELVDGNAAEIDKSGSQRTSVLHFEQGHDRIAEREPLPLDIGSGNPVFPNREELLSVRIETALEL